MCATNQWFGKPLSVDSIECPDEHSNVIIGHAVEQALALSTTEGEEKLWVYKAAISIQREVKENGHSPIMPAITLLAPVSITIPISLHLVLHICPPLDVMPHSPADLMMDSAVAMLIMDGWDSKPWQLEQAVKTIRCSDKHLETDDSILKGLDMSAPRASEGKQFPGPTEQQPAFLVISKNERRVLQHSPVSLKLVSETGWAISGFLLHPGIR